MRRDDAEIAERRQHLSRPEADVAQQVADFLAGVLAALRPSHHHQAVPRGGRWAVAVIVVQHFVDHDPAPGREGRIALLRQEAVLVHRPVVENIGVQVQIRRRVGIAPHIAAVGADALTEAVIVRVVGGERAHLRQIEHGARECRPMGRQTDGMGAGGAADIQRRAAGTEGQQRRPNAGRSHAQAVHGVGKQPHSVGVERMGFKQPLLAVHLRGILSDGAFQVFQRENLAVFNHQIPKIAEIMRVVFNKKVSASGVRENVSLSLSINFNATSAMTSVSAGRLSTLA
ncbi:hypothetical protein AK51_03250 [Serratia nematodiphila DZ0503SBS1]|nr:hypothetical protein AK51_03250 [Serratia nematodiphila DZ0503SBS1]